MTATTSIENQATLIFEGRRVFCYCYCFKLLSHGKNTKQINFWSPRRRLAGEVGMEMGFSGSLHKERVQNFSSHSASKI